jgi:hypothetical protein
MLNAVVAEVVLDLAECCPDGFPELTADALAGEELSVFRVQFLEVFPNHCEGPLCPVDFQQLLLHFPAPDVLEAEGSLPGI